MYYEIHGEGEPLILLHGGLATIEMLFPVLLPQLSASRQVIAVELQGHGHTPDIDRPFSYEQFADDVAALIEHLGFESADVMGFSLGGGVALQTAIRHPEAVRKLVIVSAPFASSGWYPEVFAGMGSVNAGAAEFMLETPMYQFYSAVAPRPEDWPTLLQKSGDLLRPEYDWSEQVAALTAPVLIVAGDADSVTPAHAVEFFGLLGGGKADGAQGGRPASQLVIVPDATHFTILYRADILGPAVNNFLSPVAPPAQ
jgi:pimeloyl-ACP methyl ester carboxylesterase